MKDPEIPEDLSDVTIEWLQKIINKHFTDFKIKRYKLDSDINHGHGQVSNLTAITIHSQQNTKHMVIKLPSDNEIIKIHQFDYRETQVYSVLLKDLAEFSNAKNVTVNLFSPPQCYFSKADLSSGKSVLVLENLYKAGYKMADYEVGLDYDHLAVAVKVLARYHASVFAMKISKNIVNYKEVYPFIIGTDLQDEPNQYIKYGFDFVVKMLREAGVEQEIINKIDIADDAERIIAELLKPKYLMSCLNHGDCTGRNFMFLYDDIGKPTDAKLLDYQACMYTSRSTNDLYLLLLCSGKTEVLRGESLRLLEELYHSTLTSALHEHGLITWTYPHKLYEEDLLMGRLISTLHCISGAPVWFAKSSEAKKRLVHVIKEANRLQLLDKLNQY